ncbi:MAG: guaA 2 [Gammaproteobacteria bacterium]|jgi:GMP synthase (glutamine-hydrolysing)|nr:guaA 2 [Gammaproteobacteria bacterium]
MRIHCIIHADFETPGYYETWAQKNGLECATTHIAKNKALPSVDDFDILLCLGGPQSPRQIEQYPYLKDEIALIKQAIVKGKKVLGVCLGAQLIAESYGVKTEKSPYKEIGVFPLSLTEDGKADPFIQHFPEEFQSGHWHHDMPGIPPQAKILAYSEGCPRQIVCFSPKVYGFQCHLELDPQRIQWLIQNCPGDLTSDRYVQDPETILSHDYAAIHYHLELFLQKFILGKQHGASIHAEEKSHTLPPSLEGCSPTPVSVE